MTTDNAAADRHNHEDRSAHVVPKRSAPLSFVGGLVAAAVGLAVAEMPALFSNRLRSPVFDVGDRVVDRVPAWLKNLAIDLFGTNDKLVLLATIAALLAVYAGILGVLALRRRNVAAALVGVALFGLVGSLAALNARSSVGWTVAVPSVIGGIGAGLVLVAMSRIGQTQPTPADPSVGDGEIPDRRRFLTVTAALGASAVVVGSGARRIVDRQAGRLVQRVAGTLPSPAEPLATVPSAVSAPVEGVSSFFTSNDDFYRIDTALSIPTVSISDWTLRVTGLVDREIELSFEELLERDVVEADITLTCVSNEVGGNLMGTARWLGVRLDSLLEEAGVSAEADQIVGRSVDGYTCGFPTSTLDGRDALIAVAMNGEPLPAAHGFPARLIVPGLYGYVSATKWLEEIELTRFEDFDQYWVPRGWSAIAPIKTASRIDTPRGLAKSPPGLVPIAGVAWAQTVGIEAVEVSIDEGPWIETVLADEANDVTWRQWHHPWMATPGRHTITARAIDKNGAIQIAERSEPMPDGVTGHHQIVVLIDQDT